MQLKKTSVCFLTEQRTAAHSSRNQRYLQVDDGSPPPTTQRSSLPSEEPSVDRLPLSRNNYFTTFSQGRHLSRSRLGLDPLTFCSPPPEEQLALATSGSSGREESKERRMAGGALEEWKKTPSLPASAVIHPNSFKFSFEEFSAVAAGCYFSHSLFPKRFGPPTSPPPTPLSSCLSSYLHFSQNKTSSTPGVNVFILYDLF